MGLSGKHIVGALRVKNEARWITDVIKSMTPICDHIVLFDDGSSDNTVELAFGASDQKLVVVHTPFNTMDEARDKDLLLSMAAAQPTVDWIVMIDGDEVLEPLAPMRLVAAIESADKLNVSVLSMQVCYLWDSPNMWRTDGLYGDYFRPSMFKVAGVNRDKLKFTRTGNGPNLHCSNFPQGLPGGVSKINCRLLHYGYMYAEDRQRKYEWYNKIDPNNRVEDGYKHIVGLPSRHAPGPVHLEPWSI